MSIFQVFFYRTELISQTFKSSVVFHTKILSNSEKGYLKLSDTGTTFIQRLPRLFGNKLLFRLDVLLEANALFLQTVETVKQ